jgi:uncharacterized protein YqeY
MLKQRIDQELKQALLAGDKTLATTLRGLKSVILYAEVAKGSRDTGLSDEEILVLFAKESKKRQESADLYVKGGNQEKADAELEEKRVIDAYLPAQLSDEELSAVVKGVIAETGASDMQAMGQVITAVKAKTEGQANGGRIAAMVKEMLGK